MTAYPADNPAITPPAPGLLLVGPPNFACDSVAPALFVVSTQPCEERGVIFHAIAALA